MLMFLSVAHFPSAVLVLVWISNPTQVSHKHPEEITFRIHQKLKVKVLQPAAVSVYEYYDRESQRTSIHPSISGLSVSDLEKQIL